MPTFKIASVEPVFIANSNTGFIVLLIIMVTHGY